MWFSCDQNLFPLTPFKISIDVSNTRCLKKEATSKNPAPKNFTKNFKILKEIQIESLLLVATVALTFSKRI